MKEVQVNRYVGPFEQNPFMNQGFIQSPIGLVPKHNGKATRLIFHLSYPKNGTTSVNFNTPKEICSVNYPDFTEAIKICISEGVNCYCAKSDWKSAFRHFRMKKSDWNFLLLKAQHPISKRWYFFVDKCMPFGSSISCAHFRAFSDAVAHIMTQKMGKSNVNYLDDFLFIALMKWL